MKCFRRWLLACVVAGAACLSCGSERPTDVLGDRQMENLLIDYHLAKALADELPSEQRYRETYYVRSVLEKHGVDEAQFDSTLAWYSANPQKLDAVYQRVIKRLQDQKGTLERQVAISGAQNTLVQEGDSVDIWPDVPMLALSGLPHDNKVTFLFDNNSQDFFSTDTLRFSARFRFLHAGNRVPPAEAPVMALSIRFRNDSVVSRVSSVEQAGVQTLTLQDDTLGRIKQVSGFIYLPPQTGSRILLLDHLSLVRLHAKDGSRNDLH